ncbi:hypothetical protein IJD44_07795 [bacterium]|nr:hypothetical protein [bacterium]
MLKIKDNVDLRKLKKYGFKEIQQNKRINYIFFPGGEKINRSGNVIVINNDRNLFNYDYYIGEDREIHFDLNPQASYEFEEIMDKFFDLIKADLVEKVVE